MNAFSKKLFLWTLVLCSLTIFSVHADDKNKKGSSCNGGKCSGGEHAQGGNNNSEAPGDSEEYWNKVDAKNYPYISNKSLAEAAKNRLGELSVKIGHKFQFRGPGPGKTIHIINNTVYNSFADIPPHKDLNENCVVWVVEDCVKFEKSYDFLTGKLVSNACKSRVPDKKLEVSPSPDEYVVGRSLVVEKNTFIFSFPYKTEGELMTLKVWCETKDQTLESVQKILGDKLSLQALRRVNK